MLADLREQRLSILPVRPFVANQCAQAAGQALAAAPDTESGPEPMAASSPASVSRERCREPGNRGIRNEQIQDLLGADIDAVASLVGVECLTCAQQARPPGIGGVAQCPAGGELSQKQGDEKLCAFHEPTKPHEAPAFVAVHGCVGHPDERVDSRVVRM